MARTVEQENRKDAKRERTMLTDAAPGSGARASKGRRGGVRTAALVTLVAVAGAVACDDATGPGSDASVSVSFRAADQAVPVAGQMAASTARASTAAIPVEGSNGTLQIDGLHVIVEDFELERLDDDGCPEEDDSCEKFEAGPSFVEVPLDGERVVVVQSLIDPDTYDALEFEVDDLDDGEPSEELLLVDIRSEFPDWPEDASLLVVGSFTPDGGDPIPFRVYFEAEVEIELDLSPPVVIGENGDQTFTVELDPGLWFRDGSGGVRNLALLDFDQTGTVAELEVEIENGFVGVEFDD